MNWIQDLYFERDDGGRAAAGYRGRTGDCVVRAIAIAAELPYVRVYDDLFAISKAMTKRKRSPRLGVPRKVFALYLDRLGWEWVPTVGIGTGCKMHLRPAELPKGRIICRLSKHLVAVVDGTVRDLEDPSRGGTRCVYGYFKPKERTKR